MRIAFLACALCLVTTVLTAQHEGHQVPATSDTLKKSIAKELHAQVGKAHMMLRYYAPAVRGRVIWGGLVPYDEVWVTGAHSATTIQFDQALVIANETIPAGKYAVFTIPGKEKWTVIINKNWEQHLADEYDSKDDVVRAAVIPEYGPVTERLGYGIINDGDSNGKITIAWEKVKISLPFQVTK
jgi:hypothetical protein